MSKDMVSVLIRTSFSQFVGPIRAEPIPTFSLVYAALGTTFDREQLARKRRFDLPPAGRKIVVTLGQGPDTVQVIRQYQDRLHRKWVCSLDLAESSS
jgi:hypothetical protein